LEGLVDIYLADFKYGDDSAAVKYSQAINYFDIASKAVQEMFRQTGHITMNDSGIAIQGLAVRLLVLPEDANN
jgi:putative pyruvate formate lyase activating enzyme